MSEPTYKIKPSDLNTTTIGGATRLEIAYAEERKAIPLKGKYRPRRGSLPQWGVGGDHSSKTNKLTDSPQALVSRAATAKQPQRKMVMVVLPNGKRRMEEE